MWSETAFRQEHQACHGYLAAKELWNRSYGAIKGHFLPHDPQGFALLKAWVAEDLKTKAPEPC